MSKAFEEAATRPSKSETRSKRYQPAAPKTASNEKKEDSDHGWKTVIAKPVFGYAQNGSESKMGVAISSKVQGGSRDMPSTKLILFKDRNRILAVCWLESEGQTLTQNELYWQFIDNDDRVWSFRFDNQADEKAFERSFNELGHCMKYFERNAAAGPAQPKRRYPDVMYACGNCSGCEDGVCYENYIEVGAPPQAKRYAASANRNEETANQGGGSSQGNPNEDNGENSNVVEEAPPAVAADSGSVKGLIVDEPQPETETRRRRLPYPEYTERVKVQVSANPLPPPPPPPPQPVVGYTCPSSPRYTDNPNTSRNNNGLIYSNTNLAGAAMDLSRLDSYFYEQRTKNRDMENKLDALMAGMTQMSRELYKLIGYPGAAARQSVSSKEDERLALEQQLVVVKRQNLNLRRSLLAKNEELTDWENSSCSLCAELVHKNLDYEKANAVLLSTLAAKCEELENGNCNNCRESRRNVIQLKAELDALQMVLDINNANGDRDDELANDSD